VEEELKQAERQEMERLLYVALTRAKHTLVLAYDREFFLTAKGEIPSESQMKWLRGDTRECNCEAVASLATEARECAETSARQRAAPVERVRDTLGRRELGLIDNARQNAARFIHTVSPSKFSPEEEIASTESADVWMELEPELRPPRIENPATRYGLWWHEFVQQIPWGRAGLAFNCSHGALSPCDGGADRNAPAERGDYNDEELVSSWDEIFADSIMSSPDPARSKREWEMLKTHLASSADFRRRITATIVHPEMPFFWRLDESKCLEGIVDLALLDGEANRCLIIDWKTNRIADDKIDNLREMYRPQIAAYWKAVTELTPNAFGVAAGIYSTSTGQFIDYDSDELAREWERLRNLTQLGLTAELASL